MLDFIKHDAVAAAAIALFGVFVSGLWAWVVARVNRGTSIRIADADRISREKQCEQDRISREKQCEQDWNRSINKEERDWVRQVSEDEMRESIRIIDSVIEVLQSSSLRAFEFKLAKGFYKNSKDEIDRPAWVALCNLRGWLRNNEWCNGRAFEKLVNDALLFEKKLILSASKEIKEALDAMKGEDKLNFYKKLDSDTSFDKLNLFDEAIALGHQLKHDIRMHQASTGRRKRTVFKVGEEFEF
jgi:hypothetical protein